MRLDVGSADSLGNVEGAIVRAPSDPVMTIHRVEHVVSKTTEFTSVMQNVTGIGFQIVTNVGAQLHNSELLGGDALDQSVLVESAGQDELA